MNVHLSTPGRAAAAPAMAGVAWKSMCTSGMAMGSGGVREGKSKGSRIVCSVSSPKGNIIKVVVNGAGKDLGKAAIAAVHKARGMELAGAVDALCVGRDAGEVAGLDEELELPVLNDLVMVLGSLSQATAFGMKSVVCAPDLDPDLVDSLSTFCEKSSMIIESQHQPQTCPSAEAKQLANNLSGLGRLYNDGDLSEQNVARGAVIGDAVRVHSLAMPGLMSSMEVRLSTAGEVLSYKHDICDVRALMPGLLLAIRRVVRLKNLVYGLEKIL